MAAIAGIHFEACGHFLPHPFYLNRQFSGGRQYEALYARLSSAEQHIARVRARVLAGGHDIPEAKIRERCSTALQNLIALLPHLAHLQVYDNSIEAAPGTTVTDPVLVAEMRGGKLGFPTTVEALQATPQWAKPLLEAALALGS